MDEYIMFTKENGERIKVNIEPGKVSKKLTKIKLCFENVECCTIEAKNVATYFVGDIRRDTSKDWYSEVIHEYNIAHDTKIILMPEANVVTEQFWEPDKIFDRVTRHNDIVSVEFYYSDQTSEEIYLHWAEGFTEINYNQTSLITDNGYLIIVVSETEKAESLREMVESIKPASNKIKGEKL